MYIVPIVIIILGLLLIFFVIFIIGKISDLYSSITYSKKSQNNEETKKLADEEKINKLIGAILGIKIQQTSSYDEIWKIASEYGDYRSKNKGVFPGVYPISALSHPKEEIKIALAKLIILDNSEVVKELASANYLFLDDVVEDEIYSPLKKTFGELEYENIDEITELKFREMAENADLATDWFKLHRARQDTTLNELIKLRMLAGLEVDDFVSHLSELRKKNI